jgi:hypothetical protein
MSGNTVETGFEFKYAVVNVADDITTVSTRMSMIRGVYVNTVLSGQALPIKDGSTTVFTIPASAAAGSYHNFGDAVFKSGIVVDPDNSATGSVTVVYKPVI